MKKPPYPDKKITDKVTARAYFEQLMFNTLSWLKIDGYTFMVYLPGETYHSIQQDAGLSISVEYPYKKFRLSVQESTLKLVTGQSLKSALWENLECSMFHEVFHIILWKLNEIAMKRQMNSAELRDADEETCDHLAHAFYPIVQENRSKKKK